MSEFRRITVINPENRKQVCRDLMAGAIAGTAGFRAVANMTVEQMVEYSGGEVSPLEALDFITSAERMYKSGAREIEIPRV